MKPLTQKQIDDSAQRMFYGLIAARGLKNATKINEAVGKLLKKEKERRITHENNSQNNR